MLGKTITGSKNTKPVCHYEGKEEDEQTGLIYFSKNALMKERGHDS